MSNRHDEVHDLLPLAAAGALDPHEDGMVRRHVAECAACAAELEEWRAVVESLAPAPVEVPAGLAAEAIARVRSRESTALNPALVAVLIGLSWVLWSVLSLAVAWAVAEYFGIGRSFSLWAGLAGAALFTWVTAGVAVMLLGRSPLKENFHELA